MRYVLGLRVPVPETVDIIGYLHISLVLFG